MPISRQEIKQIAKQRFEQYRSSCIAVYVLFTLLSVAVSGLTYGLGFWLIMPVLYIAMCGFFYRIYLGDALTVSDFFSSMFDNYLRKTGAYLWMMLWTGLWSMLFLIPGIIKALSYMLTPYIVFNHPNVTATNALKLSMRMTNGYKADLFIAFLSFIGWTILSALTMGILEIIYVGSYRQTTFGGIYQELEKSALENGTVTQEMLDGTIEPV